MIEFILISTVLIVSWVVSPKKKNNKRWKRERKIDFKEK